MMKIYLNAYFDKQLTNTYHYMNKTCSWNEFMETMGWEFDEEKDNWFIAI